VEAVQRKGSFRSNSTANHVLGISVIAPQRVVVAPALVVVLKPIVR
jgi:hypothetical protein